MSALISWLNENSTVISAIATIVTAVTSVVIVIFTRSLTRFSESQAKWTEASAKTTATLKEIEHQRDRLEKPRVHIWFEGYHPTTEVASFVMQNAGKKNLFLRSLQVHSPGMTIETFTIDQKAEKDSAVVPKNELRDIVLTPEKIQKFLFKFSGGSGQHFELLAQLYSGDPVRIAVSPSQLNGYEYRIDEQGDLKGFFNNHPLGRDGRV